LARKTYKTRLTCKAVNNTQKALHVSCIANSKGETVNSIEKALYPRVSFGAYKTIREVA